MSLDKEAYLKYIAYFTERIDNSYPSYKKYFKKELGSKPTLPKIKNLARHLYKSYVLSLLTDDEVMTIATLLTSEQIVSYVKDLNKLQKKYGIDHRVVDTTLTDSVVDEKISNSSIAGHNKILGKIMG